MKTDFRDELEWRERKSVVKIKLFRFSRSDETFPFTTIRWKSKFHDEINEPEAEKSEALIDIRMTDGKLPPPPRSLPKSKLQLWLSTKQRPNESAHLSRACNFLLLSGHHLKWIFSFTLEKAFLEKCLQKCLFFLLSVLRARWGITLENQP